VAISKVINKEKLQGQFIIERVMAICFRKKKRVGGGDQVVDSQPTMHKALSSTPSITKKKKKGSTIWQMLFEMLGCNSEQVSILVELQANDLYVLRMGKEDTVTLNGMSGKTSLIRL
jgi:hypothetical protein